MGRHEFVNPRRAHGTTALKPRASLPIRALNQLAVSACRARAGRADCGRNVAASFIADSSATRAFSGALPRFLQFRTFRVVQGLGGSAPTAFSRARLGEGML